MAAALPGPMAQPKIRQNAGLARLPAQGGQVVARMRRYANALLARSRDEVLKEIRNLERKVAKGLHAASEAHVARLGGRVAMGAAVTAARRPCPMRTGPTRLNSSSHLCPAEPACKGEA